MSSDGAGCATTIQTIQMIARWTGVDLSYDTFCNNKDIRKIVHSANILILASSSLATLIQDNLDSTQIPLAHVRVPLRHGLSGVPRPPDPDYIVVSEAATRNIITRCQKVIQVYLNMYGHHEPGPPSSSASNDDPPSSSPPPYNSVFPSIPTSSSSK